MGTTQRPRRPKGSFIVTWCMLAIGIVILITLPSPSRSFHTTAFSPASHFGSTSHSTQQRCTTLSENVCNGISLASPSSSTASVAKLLSLATTANVQGRVQNGGNTRRHGAGIGLWSSGVSLQATSTTGDEEGVAVASDSDPLPQPRVGDVVRYPGKWQDDIALGEVLNLQYIEGRGKWIADVLPLKLIGDNQYARQRGARKTVVVDVDTLQPVRAFYVRSANAFQVMTRIRDGGISYVSEQGYDLTAFALPETQLNLSELEKSLESYEALKKRILLDTIRAGAVGSLLAAATTANVDNGLCFGLGALFATFYVLLLGKSADSVAFRTRSASSAGWTNTLTDIVRISLPASLALTLAAINIASGGAHFPWDAASTAGDVATAAANTGGVTAANFLTAVIPRSQFASAMIGFVVSYRLPLVYRELKDPISNLNSDGELSRLLPGSLGAGSRLMSGGKDAILPGLTDRRGYVAGNEEVGTGSSVQSGVAGGTSGANEVAVPIVVVSGPKGIGKSTLIRELSKRDQEAGVAPMTMAPVWCTNRPPRADEKAKEGSSSEEFIFMPPMKFEEQERALEFIRMTEDAAGNKYGLRLQDILKIWNSGKIPLIEADRALVETLMGINGLVLVGVWVSLDSIAAIEDRLRQGMLAAGAVEGDELESAVKAKTRSAISDIEFSLKSGVFDITVIFNDIEESVGKLRRAINYASRY